MNPNNFYEWWINFGLPFNQSKSWYNTVYFDFFITSRSADFSYVHSYVYPGSSYKPNDVSMLKRGDFMVLDLQDQFGQPGHDNAVDHVRVITGWGYISPFTGDYSGPDGDRSQSLVYSLIVSQHSIPRWEVNWNYNLWNNNYNYTWGFKHRLQ